MVCIKNGNIVIMVLTACSLSALNGSYLSYNNREIQDFPAIPFDYHRKDNTMPIAAILKGLAEFQNRLIGTWTNKDIGNSGQGGQTSPLSYNVMPLPQAEPQMGQNTGYILKNFTYYETLKFDGNSDVSLPATAPNRGSNNLQVPTALFYGQQVFFADGPGINTIVHVENGAWLNLLTGAKIVGPYGTPAPSPIKLEDPNQQPPTITIAKQISVPHGNSILALGHFGGPTKGVPKIPDSASILPTPVMGNAPIGTSPYTTKLDQTDNYQNPSPSLTANPNIAIQKAVKLVAPNMFIHWSVSTENKGETMNIPFEQREVDVAAYSADYWLLSNDVGKNYPYLVYTQNITLQIPIKGTLYKFPHVTCNCVTKS